MSGARDVARVLDSRVRHLLDGVQPHPFRPWAEQVPSTGSADLDRYLSELAEAMDDRVRRARRTRSRDTAIVGTPGPRPRPRRPDRPPRMGAAGQPRGRLRERYGYAHPADPIGPAPAKTSPEARAAWHAALGALGRVNGIDLRACTDGELWLRRGTYERETAWAPPHVAEELRLACIAERDAHVNAIRAEHERRAAHDEQAAARHQQLARIWRALEAKAATEAGIFAAAQETRRQWETVTEPTRRIAIAADLELRRRHPGRRIPPLRPPPRRSRQHRQPRQSWAGEVALPTSWKRPGTSRPSTAKPMPSVLSGSPCTRRTSRSLSRCSGSGRTPGPLRPYSTTWRTCPNLVSTQTTCHQGWPGQLKLDWNAMPCFSLLDPTSCRPPRSLSAITPPNQKLSMPKQSPADSPRTPFCCGGCGRRARA